MGKLYVLAEKGSKSHEVKVDQANVSRQKRDLEARGYTVTVMDEDERNIMHLAQQITKTYREGRI